MYWKHLFALVNLNVAATLQKAYRNCKVAQRPGATNVKLLCFGPVVRVMRRHVCQAGLPHKPGCTSANVAQARDPILCKPKIRERNQLLFLIVEQRNSDQIY